MLHAPGAARALPDTHRHLSVVDPLAHSAAKTAQVYMAKRLWWPAQADTIS